MHSSEAIQLAIAVVGLTIPYSCYCWTAVTQFGALAQVLVPVLAAGYQV